MKRLWVLSCVLLLGACCTPPKAAPPPEPVVAVSLKEVEPYPKPDLVPFPTPETTPRQVLIVPPAPVTTDTKSKRSKKKVAPSPIVVESTSEPMDTLEVETDTRDWRVGKVGIIIVTISAPGDSVGLPDGQDVDIGVDAIPVSPYYLVALEPALDGYFEILPAPGQQPKQHRAKSGYSATWRYQVIPIKAGKADLLFTLKTYQSDTDQWGTNISMRPWSLEVGKDFSSRMFITTRWVSHNGGWGAIIGLISAGLTALAYTEWWKRRGKAIRSRKINRTSNQRS